jgi:hypothetical protein
MVFEQMEQAVPDTIAATKMLSSNTPHLVVDEDESFDAPPMLAQ